jgi:bifunctional enzyme CysN/CysC
MSSSFKASDLIARDIDAYLHEHRHKSLLRFITCGSVDDGKSTLIGRLLYDSKMIFEDQLAALEADSKRMGTQGQEIDFALLVDGLAAEREQGITIDVAYRFFSTDRRKYIVADTPGHEQYTRNMVTGASTAELAVILIDARKGILPQTRRHSYLVHLLGIRRIVLAVNKMDLVQYDRKGFHSIVAAYRDFATGIGISEFVAIPISGFKGDNITAASPNTPLNRHSERPALIGRSLQFHRIEVLHERRSRVPGARCGLATRVTLRRRHRFPIRQVQRTTVPPVAGLSISTRPPSARAR